MIVCLIVMRASASEQRLNSVLRFYLIDMRTLIGMRVSASEQRLNPSEEILDRNENVDRYASVCFRATFESGLAFLLDRNDNFDRYANVCFRATFESVV